MSSNRCLSSTIFSTNRGPSIAEWYHTQLWSLVHCAMPWAVSLSLGATNSFWTQAQHWRFIHDSIWFIWFDTIICLSNLSCELWNRKLKIKEIYFNNNYSLYQANSVPKVPQTNMVAYFDPGGLSSRLWATATIACLVTAPFHRRRDYNVTYLVLLSFLNRT